MTGMEEKTTTKGLTIAKIKEQAEITAKDAIRELQESLDHGFMTYPELIRILKFYLQKSIVEMRIFRPDNLPFSLKKVGLNKIYRALVKLEKKEKAEIN